MIPGIKELNLPKYATLTSATCVLADMGEKTITADVNIDGDIAPDFSYDWELEFLGEKYIMPLRTPQASKENTSLDSVVRLTFQHKAMYELKRYFFFTVQPIESGTVIADQYIASVSLNLGDLCNLFSQVLEYYYGDSISIDLNPEWEYSSEPVNVEISYSYLWDVLLKLYELFAVRWQINRLAGTDNYVIKVGYATTEQTHIFEYGFEGGLLKVERQVQDENIRNMLLGKGGEQNLPYRYFKDVDPDNPTFRADPDWIPELRNIYFSELRGKTFRDYVRGWKTNPRRQLTEADGTPITPYPHDESVKPIAVEEYDAAYGAESFAYFLGHTDKKFNPVEYVADKLVVVNLQVIPAEDSSIAKYGRLLGGLDNNEDIYPTIQGVVVDPYDRIDEAVEIEPIVSDNVQESVENDAQIEDLSFSPISLTSATPGYNKAVRKGAYTSFHVEKGKVANIEGVAGFRAFNPSTHEDCSQFIVNTGYTVRVFNASNPGEERSASGIPEGDWYFTVDFEFNNSSRIALNVECAFNEVTLTSASGDEKWGDTWDIWVKNLWGTDKMPGESDLEYAERVWGPILGDHLGNEAKVVFSDGMLSMSEDYEFLITAVPKFERKICEWETVDKGRPVKHTYESEWRITLAKCDADLESTGLYVPSTMRQAVAGNHFFFVGIDLPHQYVLWAEERLDAYKSDQLKEVSDIKPTWVVSLDKVRIGVPYRGEVKTLLSQLSPGDTLRLADKRFIKGVYETLYLQSITYTFNEPTSDDAALIPDVEIVLSDKYETSASPVSTLTGEVSALAKQVGSISNIEQIVRTVGDKLYLRKDGIPDRSLSPTEFAGLLTSLGFRSGMAGGQGWGFFKDENGNWVLETDRLNVRQDMQVNNLVINQITARGGMTIESAASMEITHVEVVGNNYVCYFDRKAGTVANLFKVDDVAWCSRFTPNNAELKFYKRRVMAVTEDSVSLTMGYDRVMMPNGIPDTGVNGEGIPSKGDVIVHFGNYTDPNRRYVKVCDVVGGGYERYLEGLDSVNSTGKEYYYVGRQDGNSSRWFIGDSESDYAEYKDGKLILRCALSIKSTVDGKELDSFVGDMTQGKIDALEIGGENLYNGTRDFDGSEWVNRNTMIDTGELYEGCKVLRTIDNTSIIYQPYTNAVAGAEYVFSVWAKWDKPGADILLTDGARNVYAVLTDMLKDGAWHRLSVCVKAESKALNLVLIGGSASLYLAGFKLERGNKASGWSPSAQDSTKPFDYLREALKQDTAISGGLIQSSQIRLGYADNTGRHIMAGSSGLYAPGKPGGGIAIWAGADMIDAADTSTQNEVPAKMLFRMDGTGYAANNVIKFEDDRVRVGENVVMDKSGFLLLDDDNNERLRITNIEIDSFQNMLQASETDINTSFRKSITIEYGNDGFNIKGLDSLSENLGLLAPGYIVNCTTMLSFQANFAFPDLTELSLYRRPTLAAIIRKGGIDGEIVSRSQVRIEPVKSGNYNIVVNTNYLVETTDNYVLTFEVDGITPIDSVSTLPTSALLQCTGKVYKTFSQQTLLCRNGFASVWGNTLLYVSEADGVVMRCGSYALKVGRDGIKKSVDGGQSFTQTI